MNIREENGNTIIENVIDFNISQTLECGQCFRYDKISKDEYVVVAYSKVLHIKQEKDRLIFLKKDREEVENIWIKYLDLDRDYSTIKETLIEKNSMLKEAIELYSGVRILNQEFHEMLISYIISQNKQIPHIMKIVKELCEKYGDYIDTINNRDYYTFPGVDVLKNISQEEFRELKTGFRAPYLRDAVVRMSTDLTYENISALSYEEAKNILTSVKGVGDKVANCVLLFGLGHRNAFPVDVWIKRTVENVFFEGRETSKTRISEFAKESFGQYGGYAQQYLFFYGREQNKKTQK